MKLKNDGVRSIRIFIIIVVIGTLGFAGYKYITNSDDNEPMAQQHTLQQAEQKKDNHKEKKLESKGTIITTGNSEFGTMLFDNKQQAIYIWELEESSKAECYGDCAEAWPPVLTDGAPRATGDVNNKLLGTTKRTDGTTQVTYNGHPLYYYAHEAAGEVKCHNISTHGGLWWVIQPNGNRAD